MENKALVRIVPCGHGQTRKVPPALELQLRETSADATTVGTQGRTSQPAPLRTRTSRQHSVRQTSFEPFGPHQDRGSTRTYAHAQWPFQAGCPKVPAGKTSGKRTIHIVPQARHKAPRTSVAK